MSAAAAAAASETTLPILDMRETPLDHIFHRRLSLEVLERPADGLLGLSAVISQRHQRSHRVLTSGRVAALFPCRGRELSLQLDDQPVGDLLPDALDVLEEGDVL